MNPGQNVDGQNVDGQNVDNFGNIGQNVDGQNVDGKKNPAYNLLFDNKILLSLVFHNWLSVTNKLTVTSQRREYEADM